MPGYPCRPCNYPGCRVLTEDGTSRCQTHKVKPWAKSSQGTPRLTGRRAVERRQRWLTLHPMCAHCHAQTPRQLVPATEVDHVVPLARNGRDDESNFQSLCATCHGIKSARERFT